jgi:hypothetical protein
MPIARRILLISLTTMLGHAALAQPAPTTRIRGTIDQVNGQTLQITARNGDKMAVMLQPDTAVTLVVPAKLTDIEPGSYIGTAAMPQPDGTQAALEVHIFPPSRRGAGEGHRPFDLQPQSTMTNGTVGDVVGTNGRTLTLRYQGGEKQVVVTTTTPIVAFESGNAGMLVAGAHVIVTAAKAPDGALSASSVAVGKDGLTPPM